MKGPIMRGMDSGRWLAVVVAVCCGAAARPGVASPVVVDFSDVSLAANTFTFGGPGTADEYVPQSVVLSSGPAGFGTTITRYGSDDFWTGFAFSNRGDTTTNSWTNDTSSFTGGGVGGGGTFAVAYWASYDPAPLIELPEGLRPDSVKLTNTTYTALTIRDGDPNNFSSGRYGPGDFLSVTFTGKSGADGTGSTTGTATFFLADFRSGGSLIVDAWTPFSLTALGDARSILLGFDSSDVGDYGINTPTYVALDDLTLVAVPEPGGLALAVAAGLAIVLVRRRSGAA